MALIERGPVETFTADIDTPTGPPLAQTPPDIDTRYGQASDRFAALVSPNVWAQPILGLDAGVSLTWAIAMAMADESQLVWEAMAWIVNQNNYQTADANGLSWWEQLLGLSINPVNLTTDQRRERIAIHRRVGGPVNLPSIAALIGLYANGTVRLDWYKQVASLFITFISTLGVLDNIADVETALDAYLPAWILFSFIYTYLTWGQARGTAITWAQARNAGLTWGAIRVMSVEALQELAASGYENLCVRLCGGPNGS